MKGKIAAILRKTICINLVIVLFSGFIVPVVTLSEKESELETYPNATLFKPTEIELIPADFETLSTDFTYTIANNTVTITGYTGISADIVIPEAIEGLPVSAIGASAFLNRTTLRTVALPDSLRTIGERAFEGCSNLVSTSFGEGVTTINNRAFMFCTSLTSLTFPASLTTIVNGTYDIIATPQSGAFWGCNNITSVTFSNSAVDIGNNAFRGLTSLNEVNFGSNVKSIGNNAFQICNSLTDLSIPASVTRIGNNAFNNCAELSSVVFEDCAVDIGDFAFGSCTKLASVDFGNRSKSIGSSTFQNTAIVTVTIPDSTTSIGADAFHNCANLENFSVGTQNNNYSSEDGVLYDKTKTNLIKHPLGKVRTSFTVPTGVNQISSNAFHNIRSLTSVIMPDSLRTVGEGAFYNCTGLANVSFGEGVTTINNRAFMLCTSLTSLVLPASLTTIANGTYDIIATPQSGAFWGCNKITSLTFENSAVDIGNNAFRGLTSLTVISFGSNVKSIGNNAFQICNSLTDLSIPASVTRISNNAFSNCAELSSVVFEDCAADIGDFAFGNCTKLASAEFGIRLKSIGPSAFQNTALVTIMIPDSTTSIGADAFHNCAALENIDVGDSNPNYKDLAGVLYNKTGTTLIKYPQNNAGANYLIPDGVTQISENAFNNARKLTSVIMPDSLRTIGEGAFYNCTGLANASFGEGVTTINNRAFMYCTSLTSLVFPASLTTIANGTYDIIATPQSGAFWGCYSIASVTFNNSAVDIGNNAFRGLSSLTEINLGSSTKAIGNNAFQNCGLLTDLIIPASVTRIGNSAFQSCSELSSVEIPEGVSIIGDSTFSNCRSLTRIDIPWSVNSIGNNAFNNSPNVVIYTWWGSFAEEYAIARSIPVRYFANEAASIEVSLPQPTSSAQYNNYKIVIINQTTNLQFSVNVTDRLTYMFRGLTVGDTYKLTLTNRFGQVISEINNIIAQEGVNTVAFSGLSAVKTVNLRILDNTGTDVTPQSTIQWFEESGGYLLQGSQISDVAVGARIQYRIELGSTLGSKFANPAQTSNTVTDGDNNIEITLLPIPVVAIRGTVRNSQSGAALSGASVSISQMLNGKHPRTVVTTTDTNGAFSAQVFNEVGIITASHPSFINQVISKSGFAENENIGELSLTPISGAIITLNLSYTYSGVPGETPVRSTLPPDYQNMRFAVYNQTKDRAIADFFYQYPQIIIPDDASANDVIRISVSGGTNDFNTVQANITLDNALRSTSALNIVQHGSLRATLASSDNDQNVALVYSSSGRLVNAYDFYSSSVRTDPLPDGNYTVVFMGKSLFFSSIQNLSDLTAARLIQGVDYISRQVVIESGIISVIDNVHIPQFDESRFYYTDNTRTSFAVNKSTAVAGSYFALRSQLAFRDAYKDQVSDVKLIVQLPEGCAFFEDTVIFGANNIPGSYMLDGDTLTIPLVIVEDVVRFCVIPTQGGVYVPNAFVEFALDGETIRQPIGAARFEATDLKINVPDKIGQKWVAVTGTAMPDTDVIVFTNGVEVGRTRTSLDGNWKLIVDLVKPYNYSRHTIHAVVVLPDGTNVFSEKKTLTRIESYIELSKVTMIYPNGAHMRDYIIEFDFLNPSETIPSYPYWPSSTSFTFLVEFTNNDPEWVSNVRVNVMTSSGNEISLPAVYDSEARLWVAAGDFNRNHMPVSIAVDYFANEGELVLDLDLVDDLEAYFAQVAGSGALDEYISFTEIADTFEDMSEGLGDIIALFTVSNDDGESASFYSHISRGIIGDELLQSIVDSANQPSADSFLSFKDSSGIIYYSNVTHSSEETKLTIVDVQNRIMTFFAFFTDGREISITQRKKEEKITRVDSQNRIVAFSNFTTEISAVSTNDNDDDDNYVEVVYIVSGLSNVLAFVTDIVSPGMGFYFRTLGASTRIIGTELEYYDRENRISGIQNPERRDRAEIAATSIREYDIFMNVTRHGGGWQGRLFTFAFGWLAGPGVESHDNYIDRSVQADIIENNNGCTGLEGCNWAKIYLDMGGRTSLDRSGIMDGICASCSAAIGRPRTSRLIKPIVDPAGFVYEAVASNRLSGVITTAFYKTIEEDMYGDEREVIKFWDAKQYGQQNPLITNEIGWYEWDVPVGLWQVKYEKEGYQTIYSTDLYGWLPVPPPQLEVHIGMVSHAQPNVALVNGYESGIEIVFDRYMQTTTLTIGNITVMSNGEPVSGSIELLNAEENPIDPSELFASKLRFIPDTPFTLDEEVTLTISTGVRTYADVALGMEYAQEVEIQPEPKEIITANTLNIAYNSTGELLVIVTPAEAAVGKRIVAVSHSPSLAAVSEDVTLDENGMATVSVTAKLPGTTQVTLTLEGTELQKEVEVHIAMPQADAAKASTPTASLTSGEVEKGSLLTLTTTTLGASIYYTLDGSSPSVESESRRTYTEPIEINENIMLIAVAYRGGMDYSETLELYFTVTQTPVQYQLTINAGAGGSITLGASGQYAPGQVISIAATPNDGYRFTDWASTGGEFANANSAGTTFTMPASNAIITANFEQISVEPETYALTFNTGSGGTITNGASGQYLHGQTINIAATPNSGYSFSGWTSTAGTFANASNASTTFTMPASNATITASFSIVSGGNDVVGGGVSIALPETPLDESPGVSIPGGSTVTTPDGSAPITNPDGSVTLPGGGTILTSGGSKIEVPARTVVNSDGSVTLPNGKSGGIITNADGTVIEVSPGMSIVIPPDGTPLSSKDVVWRNPFTDVHDSDWFFGDFRFAFTRGLTNGTSENTFSPQGTLTRAMLVTILYRDAGEPAYSSESGVQISEFSDVAEGAWYYNAVLWAAEYGIVKGYGDGLFGPNDNLRRQDLAVILMRYAELMDYELPALRPYSGFEDDSYTADYAKAAVVALFEAGVINGRSESVFDPQGNATRAEIAAMLHRFLKIVEK